MYCTVAKNEIQSREVVIALVGSNLGSSSHPTEYTLVLTLQKVSLEWKYWLRTPPATYVAVRKDINIKKVLADCKI